MLKGLAMTNLNSSPSGSTDRIRILITDDHALVRTGLRYFLLTSDDLELVGEAASGEEALQQCAQLQPDVVLMDLIMPNMNGIAAIRTIRARWPHIQIITLTNFQEAGLVQEALQAGAVGYLLKNVTGDELTNAIRAAYAGRPTLAPEAAQALIQVATQSPAPGTDLTAREREVLALMVKGLSNPEMAERLMVSLSTVKFHISSIYSKLDVTSRAEAVAVACQYQLVT
jgi:NarL family two-component system response regulator LiaR